MNRRKFIKKGLQVSGGLIAGSIVGCTDNKFFDPLVADEAFIVDAFGAQNLYKINLDTGTGSVITTFANDSRGIILKDYNTALVIDNNGAGQLNQVDLNDGTTTVLHNTLGALLQSIARETSDTILVGDAANTIKRINLSDLSVTTLVNIGGDQASGIVLENSNSALLIDLVNGNLHRLNLSNNSYTTLFNAGAIVTMKVEYDVNRNIAYIGHDDPGITLMRVDLSTNTQLSNIGPTNAGNAVAMESSDSILVGDQINGGLYRVNADTGATSRVDDGFLTGIQIYDIAVRFYI